MPLTMRSWMSIVLLLVDFSTSGSARWVPEGVYQMGEGSSFKSSSEQNGTYQLRADCASAWECCRYEFLSAAFQRCCNDHGCCPICENKWKEGCNYQYKKYNFGSEVETRPEYCVKLICVAEVSPMHPYLKATVAPIMYNPGPNVPICQYVANDKCVDDFGIMRADGEEWFVSATCEKCQCNRGEVDCRPVRIQCPLPPHPNCLAIAHGCCPTWNCNGMQTENCPDPESFGIACVQYFDQCQTDADCEEERSCCLVTGCGKACMRLCTDRNGIARKMGETWYDSNFPNQKLICRMDGIDFAEKGELSGNKRFIYPYGYPVDPEFIVEHHSSLYDCLLESGLNLTIFADAAETISKISETLPLKSTNFFLEEFRSISVNASRNQSLDEQDLAELRAQSLRFNWAAVLPLLEEDTTRQQVSALSVGNANLETANRIALAISERDDPIKGDSPSDKHQKAFRRTDPIATQMAQLGKVMEAATADFVRSFYLPIVAVGALPLLGEASGCISRFTSFLRPPLAPVCDPQSPFRTLDGTCNNLDNNLWGAAFTKFRRILPQNYGNGISSLRRATDGEPLPSARLVSSKVNTKPNVESEKLSILHVTFGQFLDHDLTATPISRGYLGSTVKCCDDLRMKLDLAAFSLSSIKETVQDISLTEPTLITTVLAGELNVTGKILESLIVNGQRTFQGTQAFPGNPTFGILPIRPQSGECAPISIPSDDPFYSQFDQSCMEFVRSVPAPMCRFGPREQLNQHTAYLDGSVIYGVKEETTNSLRLFQDGLLKTQVTSEGSVLLPAEDDREDGCNVDDKYDLGIFCFKAGDGRVNEQLLLTFFQTVWAREHNRVAKILKDLNQIFWDDERIFQEARRIVVAEFQHVTYKEHLPTVLGNFLMGLLELNPLQSDQYTQDYDDQLEVSIANAFATAAYRFGHSQIADFIQKINKNGVLFTRPLSDMFFNPFSLYEEDHVEDLTRGGIVYPSRKVDPYFTEEIAGNLFKGSGLFGLDLVALNIQRGRDHGLPGYTEWKARCGIPAATFSDLNSVMNGDDVDALEEVYKSVKDIDLFIGGISERPFLDGILGPTFSCIVADQFLLIKKGDRFWYEYKDGPGAFSKAQLKQLHTVTLARILCNNLPDLQRITIEPLKLPSFSNPKVFCDSTLIPDYSLNSWKELGITNSN